MTEGRSPGAEAIRARILASSSSIQITRASRCGDRLRGPRGLRQDDVPPRRGARQRARDSSSSPPARSRLPARSSPPPPRKSRKHRLCARGPATDAGAPASRQFKPSSSEAPTKRSKLRNCPLREASRRKLPPPLRSSISNDSASSGGNRRDGRSTGPYTLHSVAGSRQGFTGSDRDPNARLRALLPAPPLSARPCARSRARSSCRAT